MKKELLSGWEQDKHPIQTVVKDLGGGFFYFLFSPLPVEMIQLD